MSKVEGAVGRATDTIGFNYLNCQGREAMTKAILKFIFTISVFASNIGFTLGGLVIHIWTIYITYENMGGFWAIISFFAPVISQLFWMYQFTKEFGFFNAYNVLIIALFILRWVFAVAAGLAGAKLDKLEQEKKYTY
jgi:hypothetical protein